MEIFIFIALVVLLFVLIIHINIQYAKRRAQMTEEEKRLEDEETKRDMQIW